MKIRFENTPCTQLGVNPEQYDLPGSQDQEGDYMDKKHEVVKQAKRLCGECPLMQSCAAMVLESTDIVWQGVYIGGVPLPHSPSTTERKATREALTMIVDGVDQADVLSHYLDLVAVGYHKKRLQAATARIGRRRARRQVPSRPGDTRPPSRATGAPTRPATQGVKL